MTTIVAIDLETTGLDPAKDRITEIGAVKFTSSRVEEEWSTLINPGIRIPSEITKLTGITDSMVRNAPYIDDVLHDLEVFVGSAPVLGHNVQFDLAFLHKNSVLLSNEGIDTYEMASIVMPTAERYNLRALGHAMSVLHRATHRALDDARVTQAIFVDLYAQIAKLPLDLLAEIVRLGEGIAWNGDWPFRQALRYRLEEAANTPGSKTNPSPYSNPLYNIPTLEEAPPLETLESPQELNIPEVAAILEPGGQFFKHIPGYEHRPEQVEMLRSTAAAISEGRHLIIEAGTGIGKTLAYAIPAALWATQNNSRVVISTNTINLQDQLINKDIPDLQKAMGIDLRATVLKGRANYLCPHNLEALRKRGPNNANEMRVLCKILVWLEESQSGDRGEINLNGPQEKRIWRQVSADNEGCSAAGCLKRTGGRCPFYQARQAAHTAHLLIVNHALLLADVATGNRVLPAYDTLIVDEAHHLESATTNALSFYGSQANVRRALEAIGDERKGALGWLLTFGEKLLKPGDYAALGTLVGSLTTRAFKVESRVDEFFHAVASFLKSQRGGQPMGRYTQQERIVPATRTQPEWETIEMAWDEGRLALTNLLEEMQKLWDAIRELLDIDPEEESKIESLLNSLREAHLELYEFFENVDAMVFEPDPNMIYWVEAHPQRQYVNLQAAPLHIGKLMEKYIWFEKRAVILTSATLTTTGSFDYIRNRLQATDAEELALGSPFDYENAALLYLVNNVPEPRDSHGHQLALEQGLLNVCKATGGRTLALFTSYAQLHRTANAITGPLAQEGIIVYEQGSGPSPHSLVKSFRAAKQAVLLGTQAFWEGVDIPGQTLSVLVIAKLPFAVPSDPIVAARSETFQNPFQEYTLPEAILRFRQGFGRLIRSKSDVGVVIIMDRRLLTKRYGPMFVNSLPNCTRRQGPLVNLTSEVTRWIGV